jgi:hypothetical protein
LRVVLLAMHLSAMFAVKKTIRKVAWGGMAAS